MKMSLHSSKTVKIFYMLSIIVLFDQYTQDIYKLYKLYYINQINKLYKSIYRGPSLQLIAPVFFFFFCSNLLIDLKAGSHDSCI